MIFMRVESDSFYSARIKTEARMNTRAFIHGDINLILWNLKVVEAYLESIPFAIVREVSILELKFHESTILLILK